MSDKPWHDDTHKSSVGVIPSQAIMAIGEVFTSGMDKYGHRNWENHANEWRWSDLIASTLRHIYKWQYREDLDDESGIHHLAHAMTNLTMLYTLIVCGKGTDDRSYLTNGETVHKDAVWTVQGEAHQRHEPILPTGPPEQIIQYLKEMGGLGIEYPKGDIQEEIEEK
jgi:hypothetical protein